MAATLSCHAIAKIVFLFAMMQGVVSVRIKHSAQRVLPSNDARGNKEDFNSEPKSYSNTTTTSTDIDSYSTTTTSTETETMDEGVANVVKNMEPVFEMMDRLEKKKKHWGKEGHSLEASIHFENRPWDPPASELLAHGNADEIELTPDENADELGESADQEFVEIMLEAAESNNFSRVFHMFDEDHDDLLDTDECLNFTRSVKSSFAINASLADEMQLEVCSKAMKSELDFNAFQEEASFLANSAPPAAKHSHIATTADSGGETTFMDIMKNVKLTADLKFHSWGDYNTENRPWHSGDSTTTSTTVTDITNTTTDS